MKKTNSMLVSCLCALVKGSELGGGHNSICTEEGIWYRNPLSSFQFDFPKYFVPPSLEINFLPKYQSIRDQLTLCMKLGISPRPIGDWEYKSSQDQNSSVYRPLPTPITQPNY